MIADAATFATAPPSRWRFEPRRITRRSSHLTLLLLLLGAPLFLHAESLPVAEKQKIETLIKRVGALKEAKFVSNGSTYDTVTAVKFLRGKWNANSSQVRSARDFIDKVATRSGTSGKPYRIRFRNGSEVQSRDFLLAELSKIET